MKLTQSKLREFIRETIEEEMNAPIWEQHLPEGWFQDLTTKAKKAYIKANPNSKYAKAARPTHTRSGHKINYGPDKPKKKFSKSFSQLGKDIFGWDKDKSADELDLRKKLMQKDRFSSMPSVERTQRRKATAVKSIKAIDWDSEPDYDELQDVSDAIGKVNPKIQKNLDNMVDEYAELQTSDDPDIEEINKLRDDIKKIAIHALKK